MQLGWIDFSKEDRQKALDVINLLSEQGAVDELGIGVIRDAFANYFFPGTSTIQTRAKYFLISSSNMYLPHKSPVSPLQLLPTLDQRYISSSISHTIQNLQSPLPASSYQDHQTVF